MRRLSGWLVLLLAFGSLAATLHAQSAQAILETTGIKGGLIVHLGCGDGRLTAALHANESYLGHDLGADPEHVAAAQKHISSPGPSVKHLPPAPRGGRRATDRLPRGFRYFAVRVASSR
jgi:hypothetical protein